MLKAIYGYLKSNIIFIIPMLVIFFYISPYLILGKDSYVLIHDYLDSVYVHYKVLAENNIIFASSEYPIENLFNGIPRISFPSEFNVMFLLHYLFGSFNAHVINQVFMRVVGFWGMYLLLKNHCSENGRNIYINVGVALAFSLLPFNPFRGLGIAGMPLALNSFLNIRQLNHTLKDYFIIGFIPFYSPFTHTGFFFLSAVFVIWIYDMLQQKRIYLAYFYALSCMSLAYIFVEYRLFAWYFFGGDFVSHREEFVTKGTSLIEALTSSLQIFLVGQPHAMSAHTQFILFSAIVSLVVTFINRHEIKRSEKKLIILIIITILIAFISVFFSISNGWRPIVELLNSFFLTSSFQMARFTALYPLLWHIIFYLSLNIIYNRLKFVNLIALMLCGQIFITFIAPQGYDSSPPNILEAGKRSGIFAVSLLRNENYLERVKNRANLRITYRHFFAEDLFNDVDAYIAKDKSDYRVVSIGIHPSIPLYNGFYTIDGYSYNYPLEYKHNFRKVIESELEKNESLKEYYDGWGSVVYIFVDEISHLWPITEDAFRKDNHIIINNLTLNTKALRSLGGEYIFSAVPISNYHENGLYFEKKFYDKNSAWDLYLYKIK